MAGTLRFRPASRRRVTCEGCGSRQTVTPPEDLQGEEFDAWLQRLATCPNCGAQRQVK